MYVYGGSITGWEIMTPDPTDDNKAPQTMLSLSQTPMATCGFLMCVDMYADASTSNKYFTIFHILAGIGRLHIASRQYFDVTASFIHIRKFYGKRVTLRMGTCRSSSHQKRASSAICFDSWDHIVTGTWIDTFVGI